MCDENIKLRRGCEIRVDTAVRIDEERDARIGVGDEIARMAEASIEELLQEHRARTIPPKC